MDYVIYLASGHKPFKVKVVKPIIARCGKFKKNGSGVHGVYVAAAEALANHLYENCCGTFVEALYRQLKERYE